MKRRYSVIIYFGHFWPPDFCEIRDLYKKIPALYLCVVFHCSVSVHIRFPIVCLCLVSEGNTRTLHDRGGRERSFRWRNVFAGVCAKLLWIALYFTKARPDTGYQFGSWSFRGIGRQDPQIMWDYDLAIAISI